MDLDINQYIDIFVEEAREHLQSLNDSLLELEKDIGNTSLINEIFRVAHTLKGMAATMGFENMTNLTHEMENVLDGVRGGEIFLDVKIIDIIFECFDMLEASVNRIGRSGQEEDNDYKPLIKKLTNTLKGDQQLREESAQGPESVELNQYVLGVIKEAEKKDLISYEIHVELSPQCMLKSARAFIIFNTLEGLGDIIYSNPSVEDIEDEKFDLNFTIIFISRVGKEELASELNNIGEIHSIEITPLTNSTNLEINKLVSHEETAELIIDDLDKVDREKLIGRDKRIGKTVRVDIDRLDNLMNLVSELIIIKTRMDDLSNEAGEKDMGETIEYLERITTSLHDSVMKVRMVPIERVFNRFPRMVRDLSRELNKQIKLEMVGEETEVDRTVIDEIGDPLIHIIRNSIGHGIEKPEERIEQGKAKEGRVILKSYPDGNNVVIEVADDGRGIDIDKIRESALSKGMVTEEELEVFSHEDIMNLLFVPGFSTSAEVSDVSGRGVGLDVVKSKIESINGTIEIVSEKNKGTKFVIRIPLTLAIIQALLVNLGDEIYAIPLSAITEITNIDGQRIRDVQGQEIILYRGKTISIIRLNELMGISVEKDIDEQVMIVVNKGDKQAGLLVDNLIGQQEIVIKSLGKYLSHIKYLSGATILGNGGISLILDVNSII